MKRLRIVIFCVMNYGILHGMEQNKPKDSLWKEMAETNRGGFRNRLKGVVDLNGTLSLEDMGLTSLKDIQELLALVVEAGREVSSEELMIPTNEIVDCKITHLSLSHNPKLTTLHEDLISFSDLNEITISFTGIVEFPEILEAMPHVKKLTISKAQFNAFSENEKFKSFVMNQLDTVEIHHGRNEPNLSDKAKVIAQELHKHKKLSDKNPSASTTFNRKNK